MDKINNNPEIDKFLNIYPSLSNNSNLTESKKYLVYFNRSLTKRKSTRRRNSLKTIGLSNNISSTNLKVNKDSNIFLIDKAIEQQNNNIPRSQDIKDSLKIFLYQSNLISKLKNYFSNNDTNLNDINTNLSIINFEENIKSVISKLADNVVMEKYPINTFVIRMNEIGRDCYFLISGKLSVLKPVEYPNIKISYNDYLVYLINLYNNNEFDLLKKVITINNRDYLKFHNLEKILKDIDEIKIFIKSYCITKLNFLIKNNLINYKDIKIIENHLKEFNFNFLDYNIDENEIEENIQQILSNQYDDKISIENNLKNYILQCFKPSEDDIFNILPYEFLINESTREQNNINTAILYKYDLFLYLNPGAFFGESALENISNNRRNATIRTEEDCIIISLNQKLYGSILYESTKLIKDLDILFLRKNYFFHGIQTNIFNKLYFSMFKLITKIKDDIIFQQNTQFDSVFFLKEGEIKLETYLSAIDIFNIIKYFIDYMDNNKKYLKLTNEQIDNLKKNYLNDEELVNGKNKGLIYKEKINEINKYEIYSTKNYECLGILEFSSLMRNYISSCYVISKNAKFFEINKDNLNKILKKEKEMVQQDYYKLIKNKILIQIKRLYYLKLNFLSKINYKINQNFYNIYNIEHQNNKNDMYRNKDSYNSNLSKSLLIGDINNKGGNYENIKNYNESKNYANISNINSANYTNYIKINIPIKNKLYLKYFGHFNYELEKNNYWSPVSLRNIKYNEKYFFKKKLELINKNNSINKNNNINSINSDYSTSYNDIIKTLLSFEPKKKIIEKLYFKSQKKHFNIKKMINLGNNHIFSLKQLKEKIEKNKLNESILNLSIVKNNIQNKTASQSILNQKKKNSNLILSHKNNSEVKYKKIKLMKNFIITRRDCSNNTNNTSEINNLDSTCNNNFILNCIKNNINKNQEKKKGYNKLKDNVYKTILNKSNSKIYNKKKFF